MAVMIDIEPILLKYEDLISNNLNTSPEIVSEKIDDFCINELRGIIGNYYADKIIKENKNGKIH